MMQPSRRIVASLTGAVVIGACATAGAKTDFRSPLGAMLTPGAATGAPSALRVDPNAKVIRSTAADLPAASYLPSQAERGHAVYESTCAMCHAGGELIGERFSAAWKDRRVYDLYALVRGTMPLDNPGGLKDGQYLDVIAYLLQANKHQSSGVDSLRADTTALRKAKISLP
jgi:cytochrome c5